MNRGNWPPPAIGARTAPPKTPQRIVPTSPQRAILTVQPATPAPARRVFTLRELEAQFTKFYVNAEGRECYRNVDTVEEADGIWFLCPGCKVKYGENTHNVMVGFAGKCPPGTYTRNSKGVDTRWQVLPGSSGYDDLSLSPSILIEASVCQWHGFVGFAGVPRGSAG